MLDLNDGWSLSKIKSGFDFRDGPVGTRDGFAALNSTHAWCRFLGQCVDPAQKTIVRSDPEVDGSVPKTDAAGMKFGFVEEGWRALDVVAAYQLEISAGKIAHQRFGSLVQSWHSSRNPIGRVFPPGSRAAAAENLFADEDQLRAPWIRTGPPSDYDVSAIWRCNFP